MFSYKLRLDDEERHFAFTFLLNIYRLITISCDDNSSKSKVEFEATNFINVLSSAKSIFR